MVLRTAVILALLEVTASAAVFQYTVPVAHGPAVIEAGRLRIAELPARAALPIAVKVVAYPFGSGVEPLFKTATPVERTVRVEAPAVPRSGR